MKPRLIKLISFAKFHFPFLIIFLVAILLRAYRLNQLTTFGGDQGMDFLAVRDMVLYHKWTLIGLKTSIAPFFQGPLYLYILYPFFRLFHLQPIAGAIAAIFMSGACIVLLYATINKYFSQKIALLTTSLFAVSPEFVVYGNTPLYQNFLPFFIVLSLYLFLSEKKKALTVFFMGLAVGLGIELHFLNVGLGFALFIFILLFQRKKLGTLVKYMVGAVAGLTPTIAFELRHNFLNTRLFLNYESAQRAAISLTKILNQWIAGSAMFLGGSSGLVGSIVLVFIILFYLARKRGSIIENKLGKLTLITITVFLLLSLIFSAFGPEYPLPVWILFLILLPISLNRIFPNKIGTGVMGLLIVFNLFATVKNLNNNHGYNMPAGWTMEKISLAGKIISQDSQNHTNFNVASLVDGGTRAYPLRYTTILSGANPEGVENYPMNNFLYVVSDSDKEKLYKVKTWEIVSFSPFTIGAEWNLKDNVFLYRLDRARN